LILAQNTPKCVWRPGSARTRGLRPDPLGELKRSPKPPSRKSGPTSKGRGGGDGREGEGREKGRDFAGPIKIWLLRP